MPPTPSLTIRRATTADVPALVPLIHRVMRVSNTPDYGKENVERVITHFTAQSLTEMIKLSHSFVAERDGTLIGTASLGTSKMLNDQAIRTFFVDPDIQRSGVGTALLHAIEDKARTIGLKTLPVRSSIAGEPFYAAHGYLAIGDHWDGDERTIQMEKPL